MKVGRECNFISPVLLLAHNRDSGTRFSCEHNITKFGLLTAFDGLHFAFIRAISLNSFCVLCDFGPIARHEKPIFPSSRDSGQMHLFLKLAPLFAGERDWQRAGRAREREESREQKGNDVHTGAAATTT